MPISIPISYPISTSKIKTSISTFHDADIGIYGHRVQNVDIDVMAGFQMKAETTAGRACTGREQDVPLRESAVSDGHDPNLLELYTDPQLSFFKEWWDWVERDSSSPIPSPIYEYI